MITIPESVAFYWADPTNKTAVNVLADRTDIPPDLTLEEAERFEVALLAAQRVRVDLWRLLRSVWSATWGATTLTEFPTARLLTYGGHSDYLGIDYTPSVKRAWEEGLRYGIFDLPGRGGLVTFIQLTSSHQELEVGFCFANQKGNWTVADQLALGPAWADVEDGW